MKAEIEKILEELTFARLEGDCISGRTCDGKTWKQLINKSTSSLTSLIIKWLEGKKVKEGYINLAMENCNQLITELIGEVR